jgi:hypothetical protein
MLRNVLVKKRKAYTRKNSLYSKEDNNFSNESDGEEREAQKVLFITQETQNDEHKISEINRTIYEGECISDLIELEENKHEIRNFLGNWI